MDNTNDTAPAVESYEPPRVESLGTFTELTQQRLTPLAADNNVLSGTR